MVNASQTCISAHRFAGGPPPWRPPRRGRERARYEWREFGKAVVAWSIGSALLLAAIALVGDADRTQELQAWIARLTLVLAIWSIWPISHTVEAVTRKPSEQRG
jgi:hypothetical protein